MRYRPEFLGVIVGSMPLALAAEPFSGSQRMTGPDPLQVITGLLLILCIIVFCFLILRRYGSYTRLPPRQFQVIAQASLGQRERVVLLQAGNKQLILGVSPGRIKTLCILEEQDTIQALDSAQPPSSLFLDKLAEAMRKPQP